LVVCSGFIDDFQKDLLGLEKDIYRRMGGVRRMEFRAGRSLAHIAMRLLQFGENPVGMDAKGAPLWPAEVVGSISHNQKECCVALGRKIRFLSVGIDIESPISLDMADSIFDVVCSRLERSKIKKMADSGKKKEVLKIFCMKESVYKCQYPITEKWLDFQDLEIIQQSPVEKIIPFSVRIPNASRPPGLLKNIEGKCRFNKDKVTSIAVLKAGSREFV